MKTLKYKLYKNRKNRRLHKDIDLAGEIYNHCIALHRQYYRLFKKHLHLFQLQKHLTKLKRRAKYLHWKKLNSQTIQEIAERIEKGYLLFFKEKKKRKISLPKFKKRSRYRSIAFKQTGFKYLGSNKIKIGNHVYKFALSRPVDEEIKRMILKRDALGDFYICFSVETKEEQIEVAPGKIVGFDFGLRTFLTSTDGFDIESPSFLDQRMEKLRLLSRLLSKKRKKSRNRMRAIKNLARQHQRISNKRRNWFFQLSHKLCRKYKLISLEDLDIKGMAKRFGKKISDLAFSEFVSILKWIGRKYGTIIHFCDRYYASSKLCSLCGYYNKDLLLKEKNWDCEACKTCLDRDRNASFNILRAGASAHGLGDIRPEFSAVSV